MATGAGFEIAQASLPERLSWSVQSAAPELVILTTSSPYSGNATYAQRIRTYCESLSVRTAIWHHDDFSDENALVSALRGTPCRGLIGIHAYRSGRLFLERDFAFPFVIVLGGTDANLFDQPAERDIIQRVLASARAVVAMSAPLKARMLERYPTTLPPAITVIPPAPAFARVHAVQPLARLVIIGPTLDRTYREEVEAKLPTGALLASPVAPADLHAMMVASCGVLNSSLSEGVCGTLLEAMRLGCVCLARRNGSNEYLVEHQVTGLVYEAPSEAESWMQYLLGSDGIIVEQRRQKDISG
ncbi:uncharacterized protein MONBRDRAFT_24029 [Monosiga brevicollis MX1]|uniref:Glycosyl transferase family 1 domain-containing protein n=1 Tax=Monosiga brevicollis TaxID=81824 RepID=A9UUH7_MONBE|nr:uncharacterized protein MONBRDRAFT_24029 [Monosiga brevicollis MX1]EDQ90905.1 predicted protein [Monosiga brevicollis MX1]|eukprot:XP_001744202.1 hypothetical protein [Monosiga brevicollis MX1]